MRRSSSRNLSRRLTGLLATLSRCFEFAIPFGKDLFVPAFEFGQRRDISDAAVQADFVVMPDILLDESSRLVQRQRRVKPQTLPFDGAMVAFDLAVGLGIVRRRFHVGHAGDTDRAPTEGWSL